MTIVNFMPAHQQAPVSLHLLAQNREGLVARAKEQDVVLLLPPSEAALAEELGGGARVADDSFGFLYANDTAALRVLEGEKPLPSAVNGASETQVVSGEHWLLGDDSHKLVWAEGAGAPVSVPTSTTPRQLLDACGLSAEDLKALYLGYPQGLFVTPEKLDEPLEVSCDYVRAYTQGNCMAHALQDICAQFNREGCGRCVFGHEGGYQIGVIVDAICTRKGTAADIALLKDLCPVMAEQSLCELGRTMATTVLQALELFGAEIEQHFTKRVCPAGECKAYMTYHVLASRCTGCGECLSACEEDAIIGKAKFVHVIDQKACTQCGACLPACPEGAIVMAGAKKPKTPPKPIPCKRK